MKSIAERRCEKGLIQEQVAEATGIPLRTYVRIENATKYDKDGMDSVKTGNLRKLAAFFECSLDDLLNPPPAPVKPGERSSSKTA